ncbi:MAG: FtsX-like permease family protein [Candidatus Pacebacteria bacterium]|jgi:putative ABC transport system permease protein|nr:FtsX-like permease family protein [Candidatus Paceibacterota bacterium]MBT3512229.1 FtsX-like permease family protein [Candidatus Paceibacterota bacterium]MBT4004925.1 FtsX-like permease family protein [Candidatus Paceibacterota bacterium]MBT4358909.1 FtsX-like permease family protein [Candidatus Paceibacterota bacterium]MBT4680767.1 FtsX-like permease family protein [Candidatus Paceibacterota bacterium]
MEVDELFLLAFQALRRNVGRTLLTMLGIIIGIASVITIMSLGAGSTESIVGEISAFGANVLTVSPGKSRRGPGGSSNTVVTLVSEDAEKIEDLANVEKISRTINGNKTIVANSESTNSQISGVDAAYESINSVEFTTGGFFDEGDVLSAAKDVVLGDEVIEDLFGEDSAQYVIGETVRIDGRVFQIVGVMTDSGDALVPITTAQNILFGQNHLGSISVYVTDSELIDAVSADIEELLLIEHDIEDPELADFNVSNSQSFVDTISSVTGTLTTLLSGIAAISLVVGGIGIMNIMLVTVTERTKEIGLLKAIGAKDQNILAQFLIEAVVLTISGGVIGILLGAGIAFIASQAMSIPFVIENSSILLSFGVSVGVGIVFGYYPASQAAKLNPIDALRYE